MPPSQPPSPPTLLSRPDAQEVIDWLNKRLWEEEKDTATIEGKFPIKNVDVSTSAEIAYSKLKLTSSIASGDLAASAKEFFLQLATAATRKVNFGTVELEWNGAGSASNTKEVTHGLGAVPLYVGLTLAKLITSAGSGELFGFGVEPTSSTIFKVNATLPTGSIPGAGTKVKFFWTAIG